jgi:hypothetical protein
MFELTSKHEQDCRLIANNQKRMSWNKMLTKINENEIYQKISLDEKMGYISH